MAELTFKSAGVSTREIDLSGPTAVRPQGVPAGVIGTAQKGPAFVPITVATFADFVADFGGTDGKKFGPLAMNEWMRNARAGTYVRVLGVGDAKKRSDKGRVKNAGFVVGAQLPQNTGAHDGGGLGENAYAFDNGVSDQLDGRTFFLGALMREPYNEDGLSASSMDLTINVAGVLQADSELALAGDTANLRLEDIAGESLTLHFHAGSTDGTNQDGLDLERLDATRNLFFTFGEVGTLTLTVASNVDIDNRTLVVTDKSGNTITRVLQADGGVASGAGTDYSVTTDTIYVGDGLGTPSAVDVIAAEIRSALTADFPACTIGGAGANVEMIMAAVGELVAANHAEGDSVSQNNITAAVSGGATVTNDELANAIRDGINGAAANLSATASSGVVTITQGTAGAAGDDVRVDENVEFQMESITINAGTPGAAAKQRLLIVKEILLY